MNRSRHRLIILYSKSFTDSLTRFGVYRVHVILRREIFFAVIHQVFNYALFVFVEEKTKDIGNYVH